MDIRVELPVVRIASPRTPTSLSKSLLHKSPLRRGSKLLNTSQIRTSQMTTISLLSPKSQTGKSPMSIHSLSPSNKTTRASVNWKVEAMRLWNNRDMTPMSRLRMKLMNTRKGIKRVSKEDSLKKLFSVYKLRQTEMRLVGERMKNWPKKKLPPVQGWETPGWEGSALL